MAAGLQGLPSEAGPWAGPVFPERSQSSGLCPSLLAAASRVPGMRWDMGAVLLVLKGGACHLSKGLIMKSATTI